VAPLRGGSRSRTNVRGARVVRQKGRRQNGVCRAVGGARSHVCESFACCCVTGNVILPGAEALRLTRYRYQAAAHAEVVAHVSAGPPAHCSTCVGGLRMLAMRRDACRCLRVDYLRKSAVWYVVHKTRYLQRAADGGEAPAGIFDSRRPLTPRPRVTHEAS